MYWDAEKSTYLPAPTNSSEDSTGGEDKNKKDGKDKKEKEKSKTAKKIAKVSCCLYLCLKLKLNARPISILGYLGAINQQAPLCLSIFYTQI